MMRKPKLRYYAEVKESKVPGKVVEMAHRVRQFVETDLGLSPLAIRWFTERPFKERPPLQELDPSIAFLNTNPLKPLGGKCCPPLICGVETLWIRRVRSPEAAAIVVAHEARHVWQVPGRFPSLEECELDAEAYALDALRRFGATMKQKERSGS